MSVLSRPDYRVVLYVHPPICWSAEQPTIAFLSRPFGQPSHRDGRTKEKHLGFRTRRGLPADAIRRVLPREVVEDRGPGVWCRLRRGEPRPRLKILRVRFRPARFFCASFRYLFFSRKPRRTTTRTRRARETIHFCLPTRCPVRKLTRERKSASAAAMLTRARLSLAFSTTS